MVQHELQLWNHQRLFRGFWWLWSPSGVSEASNLRGQLGQWRLRWKLEISKINIQTRVQTLLINKNSHFWVEWMAEAAKSQSHKQKPRNGETSWKHIISGHDPFSCSGAAMESESYQWWFLPVQRSKGLPCQVETTPRLSNHVLDHWWNVVSNDARPFGGENRSHS